MGEAKITAPPSIRGQQWSDGVMANVAISTLAQAVDAVTSNAPLGEGDRSIQIDMLYAVHRAAEEIWRKDEAARNQSRGTLALLGPNSDDGTMFGEPGINSSIHGVVTDLLLKAAHLSREEVTGHVVSELLWIFDYDSVERLKIVDASILMVAALAIRTAYEDTLIATEADAKRQLDMVAQMAAYFVLLWQRIVLYAYPTIDE